jgi:UDP-glucuronate decarboxylase
MRALVTGAAGFLGSHLVDRLLERGYSATGLDNLQTGRRRNLAHLVTHARFNFIKHDIIEPFDGSFDVIFNFACPASPPHYQKDPLSTVRTCFIGADNMLALALKSGARFVQASTSEVYGDPDIHPQTEDYRGSVNPIGPRACYDEGKRAAETLCFDYRRQHGVDLKVARIFNTYGPRMNAGDGRVVSNFVVQALRGDDLTIYGDGRQTRSFCYVDDLIDAFMKLVDSPSDVVGPINLGNPGEFTVAQLARLVLEMTGSKSRLVNCPLPADDPVQRRPDITRAKTLLGWEPKIALKDGLQRTIAYFREELVRIGQ